MARFGVLHLTLTEEMIAEINGGGGWSCPCGSVYAGLTVPRSDVADLDRRILEALALGLYHVVAEVEADTLDQVFPLTNHIDHDWRDNPGVIRVHTPRVRSTSVGDLVFAPDTGMHFCAPRGWTRLRDPVIIDIVQRLVANPHDTPTGASA